MKKSPCMWVVLLTFIIISGCDGIKYDKNGRPIHDLIDQKKISVSFDNASIKSIRVKIGNRKWHNIKVLIPMGTLLSPSNISYQNMLCYANITLDLEGGDDKIIDIPVVCTNINKKVPESGISFEFEPQSTNFELNSFIEILSQTDVEFNYAISGEYDGNNETLQTKYDQMQAAVWIITDDADYEEMGILTRQISEGSWLNPRIIYEEDAANAMIILNYGGIDIKSKKIWNDRFKIYEGITEDDIKSAFKKLINDLGD